MLNACIVFLFLFKVQLYFSAEPHSVSFSVNRGLSPTAFVVFSFSSGAPLITLGPALYMLGFNALRPMKGPRSVQPSREVEAWHGGGSLWVDHPTALPPVHLNVRPWLKGIQVHIVHLMWAWKGWPSCLMVPGAQRLPFRARRRSFWGIGGGGCPPGVFLLNICPIMCNNENSETKEGHHWKREKREESRE